MASTKTRQRNGWKQPPRRGQPYYDPVLGRMRILPPAGGGARDYAEGPRPRAYSARQSLRRAGLRAGQGADRLAAGAPRRAHRAVRRADALPELGGGPTGLGGLLVYAFASIVALALLENALSGRGPAAVETVLG